MKKYLLGAAALLASMSGIAGAAYQQQGFTQYSEVDGKINFTCATECVILLGDKQGNDSVVIKGGTHQGLGQRGYGYLNGSNIYAATLLPAKSYERAFSDDPVSSQIPDEGTKVVFLVTGPLQAEGVEVSMGNRSFGQAISRTWKRFWLAERIAPFSINLHYGPMIGAWSRPLFGFVIMLIAVAIIHIRRKEFSWKKMIATGCGVLIIIMLAGGVRLLFDNFTNASQNWRTYGKAEQGNEILFDLGNYISVTDQVRKHLELDNIDKRRGEKCTIYAQSNRDRPFNAHWSSVYLRPCQVVITGSQADFHLFYNVSPSTSGELLLSGNNFILLNNRP